MKIFILLVLATSPAWALDYQVTKCNTQPDHQGKIDLPVGRSTVGSISEAIFRRDSIPYVGSEAGMNSILGTPTGDDAIDVLSDEEMLVYGWCYEVDGVQPSEMPGDFQLTGKEKLLHWFYASSHYKAGAWLSYCDPAHLNKAPLGCSANFK